jgi:NADPH-dependent curcumin reductase CurA
MTSNAHANARRIVLASRPTGKPVDSNFRLEEMPVPQAGPRQILLRVLYLSLDPYMRGRMDSAKSYAAAVEIGGVMTGECVAEVVESHHPDFAAGDVVLAHAGWQTHAISDGTGVRKINRADAPLTTRLGVLGMPGFTAYSGMRVIGQPKAGETVAVAAASGPVGSLVGQLAQLAGARAVGIAGGADKCAYLRDKLGFDVAIDHRAADFEQQLIAACPNGIDVYFENVGGAIWEAVAPLLNRFARVPVCGLIAQYSATEFPGADRLPRTMRDILTKSLTLRGFINYDFAEYFPDFIREIGPLVNNGKIKYREDIVDGFEHTVSAFIGMLDGRNFGKLLIRVAG